MQSLLPNPHPGSRDSGTREAVFACSILIEGIRSRSPPVAPFPEGEGMATPVYLDDGGMPSRRPLVRSLASNLATIALPTFYSGFNGRLGELTTAKSYPESTMPVASTRRRPGGVAGDCDSTTAKRVGLATCSATRRATRRRHGPTGATKASLRASPRTCRTRLGSSRPSGAVRR